MADESPVAATPVPPITANYIREKFEASARAMQEDQFNYVRNLNFFDGKQWVYWDRQRNTIAEYKRTGSRSRLTINRLRPSTRALMAQLLSRELVFEVPPGDSDDASIRGAHLSESVLRNLHDEHNWENIREDALMAAFLGGTSVISVDWNPSRGTTIGHLPITGEEYGTGEIEETVLSIAEIAWEPGLPNPEFGTSWIRAQVLPPESVRERYKMPATPPADASGLTSPLSQVANRNQNQTGAQNLTLVLTYYERPNSLRKDGAICTVIDNKIVGAVKPWYFPFKDKLNFKVIRETHVPGQGTGKTIFSDAIGLQTSLNATWSNIIEHMKHAGNARLMIPEGSLDGIETLSDLPGETIEYNIATGTPSYLSPPSMPEWWMQAPRELSAQIDDILGLHDISRGVTPKNVNSGVGLSILVEQDQSPLGKLTNETKRAFEGLAAMCLDIYKEFVKEPRKAYTKNGVTAECVEWSGKSLQGQLKPMVPIDAIMPRSKAAAAAMAKDMWDRKMITDLGDFLRISEFAGADDLIKTIDADIAKSERENALMAQGDICVPAEFDDHEKHIKIHNKFRKSVRYESLTDEERSVVDDHIKAHEMSAAEQMGTMVARGMAHTALPAIPTAEGMAPLPPGIPGAPPQAPEAPPLPGGTPPLESPAAPMPEMPPAA